jgi:hypothetical protein
LAIPVGEQTAGLAVAGHGVPDASQQFAVSWENARVGRRYIFEILFVVVAYYASAHVGYALGFAGPVASIVWLPVGVGAAILYLRGPALWPGVVIGDLLVNNYSALPVGSAIGQSFGNLLEVVACAVLLRRVAARDRPLRTVSSLSGVLAAIAAATAISATIGLLSLYLGHVVTLGSVSHHWRTWWLGDFCGALIVLSLVLAWSPLPRRLVPRTHARGDAAAGNARRTQPRDDARRPPFELSRVSGVDLGGAALRAARSHARACDQRRFHDLGHDSLRWTVRVS